MTLTASRVNAEEDVVVIIKAEEISSKEQALPRPTAPPLLPASTPLLPATATQQQKESVGFDIVGCGDDVRSGIRIKPGRTHFAIKLCGNTHILLPKDPPISSHYKFVMINLCGDARVCVPKNTNVILRRISLCGNRSADIDDENDTTSATSVTLTILQLCGDVHIMHHGEEGEE